MAKKTKIKSNKKTLGFTIVSDPVVIKNLNTLTDAKTKLNKKKGDKPAMFRAVGRNATEIGIAVLAEEYGVKVVK